MSRFLHNTIVLKSAVAVGIVAYYFLPTGWDVGAVLSANMLWLWKV